MALHMQVEPNKHITFILALAVANQTLTIQIITDTEIVPQGRERKCRLWTKKGLKWGWN